jgi:2-polyprenyl-6-methoxyphenol hydroxylase-like FAD-dependent oxidoreductase
VDTSRVVVVGAGPAGCAAALSLVRNGIRPVLVEKGPPGKDKACGDAWVPSAVEELRSLEIGKREVGGNWHPFSRLDGYYADRKVWSHELSPSEEGSSTNCCAIGFRRRDARSGTTHGQRISESSTARSS